MLNYLAKYTLNLSTQNKGLHNVIKQDTFSQGPEKNSVLSDFKHPIISNTLFINYTSTDVEFKVDTLGHSLGANLCFAGEVVA